MEAIQIVGLGIVAAIMAVFLRQTNSSVNALIISVVAGIIIFIAVLDEIFFVVHSLESLASKANVNQLYLATILKIIGIAYIAEFGAQVCKDAGEGAIASRIEFGAKILVLVLAVPILVAVLETIIRLIP